MHLFAVRCHCWRVCSSLSLNHTTHIHTYIHALLCQEPYYVTSFGAFIWIYDFVCQNKTKTLFITFRNGMFCLANFNISFAILICSHLNRFNSLPYLLPRIDKLSVLASGNWNVFIGNRTHANKQKRFRWQILCVLTRNHQPTSLHPLLLSQLKLFFENRESFVRWISN